jgi:hypothetical protein
MVKRGAVEEAYRHGEYLFNTALGADKIELIARAMNSFSLDHRIARKFWSPIKSDESVCAAVLLKAVVRKLRQSGRQDVRLARRIEQLELLVLGIGRMKATEFPVLRVGSPKVRGDPDSDAMLVWSEQEPLPADFLFA